MGLHAWYPKGEGSDWGVKEKCYICCDLKSFYASVECVERGLDPMTTNLVVADQRRTEKTTVSYTHLTLPTIRLV